MSNLEAWAAELRAALPLEQVPEVGVGANRLEVAVWDDRTAASVRDAAERLGIPSNSIHIVRPLVFLYPYPTDEEANEGALDEFVARNVRIDDEGNSFLLTSLPPERGKSPSVLVLGSMPGSISLTQRQYYANPGNRFWRVMKEILGVQTEAPYAERIAQLTAAGIALWDVLKHCSRIGSLDAKIVPNTETANDLATFLADEQTIERVVFNGRKAASSFRRLVEPGLPNSVTARISQVIAPSTSAANARFRIPEMVASWRAAFGA
jgi:TDG/mug DNA glycosylase family protein